jgi:predicted alpha/beta hydrolase family esterase
MATTKTKKKILFAHSAGPQYGKGKGSYNLVKYLKTKLGNEFEILFPKIEKPNSPTYGKFKRMFASVFNEITEPVILIGHSLGASTLLKYLSEEKPRILITGLFLVATPHWGSDMKEFQLKQNFQASLKDIPSIFLYHSKNDPEVPFSHLQFYKTAFNTATVRELPAKEHTFSKGLSQLVSDIKYLDK